MVPVAATAHGGNGVGIREGERRGHRRPKGGCRRSEVLPSPSSPKGGAVDRQLQQDLISYLKTKMCRPCREGPVNPEHGGCAEAERLAAAVAALNPDR